MKTFGSKFGRCARWVSAGAAVLLFSVNSFAGIAATKHNLSTGGPHGTTGGTSGQYMSTGTDQICVFCHTPHASNTGAAVPLWNKALPASGTYTLYNGTAATATSTIDGEILPVGSVSIACLSCHDGSQAMDNMLNKPGSGGYTTSAGSSLTGGVWTGTATTGKMAGAADGMPNLGSDLTNDHPIGIEYCGGGLSGATTTVSGACADSDFVGSSSVNVYGAVNAQVMTDSLNGKQVFWVNLDGNTTRQKTDIALYSRTFAAGTNRPSVECASCHDPHVASQGTDDVMFMRVSTAGSKICLSCHIK